MIRLFMVVLLTLLLTACNEPREKLLPKDVSQWETDRDFQSAVSKLTLEEQDLLATYLIRIEANLLAGEAPPENMTIGDAIREQLVFVDQWQEKRQRQKDLERAAAQKVQNYLDRVEVVSFNVLDQPAKEGGGAQKVFCGTIVNKGDRCLCDVQLTVYFLDKFGNEISAINFKPVQSQPEPEGEVRQILQPHEKIAFNYPVTEGAPANWNGMASAIVTDVAFSAEDAATKN